MASCLRREGGIRIVFRDVPSSVKAAFAFCKSGANDLFFRFRGGKERGLKGVICFFAILNALYAKMATNRKSPGLAI